MPLSLLTRLFPLLAFLLCAFVCWPGLLRPDSITQMQQGIAGSFSDFHPPIVGMLFGLLDKIHSGPGPMLLWQLALYWGAVSLFAMAQNAEPNKAKLVCVIAFLPPVFAYQLLVIKDISFVNAYLFCAAWLNFYSMRKLTPSFASLIGWLAIAFYGTAAAYQAIVALPWLCLWFAKFYESGRSKRWIINGLLLFGILAVAVAIFNHSFATPSNRSQHGKLYDLAGISVQLDYPIFPEYIKQCPNYSFEKVKQLYNPKRVDELTFQADSPLLTTNAKNHLNELHSAWLTAMFHQPGAYLKHRWGVFYQQLTVSLLKMPEQIHGETPTILLKIIGYLDTLGLFTVAKWLMSYIIYLFAQLIFLYKGLRNFNQSPRYVSLFFQNIMGISLVFSLFFVANAAEARYAYLAIAMFYFSCPLLFKTDN